MTISYDLAPAAAQLARLVSGVDDDWSQGEWDDTGGDRTRD